MLGLIANGGEDVGAVGDGVVARPDDGHSGCHQPVVGLAQLLVRVPNVKAAIVETQSTAPVAGGSNLSCFDEQ